MRRLIALLVLLMSSSLWAVPSEKCVTKGTVRCGTFLGLPKSCCHVFCPSYGEKLLEGDCAPTWYCPNIKEFFARERKECPTRKQFEAEEQAKKKASEKREKEKREKICKDDELATKNLRKNAKKERDLYEKEHGGLFVDSRDGKKYKTITIGNQEWMAENLNYKSEDSYCLDDKKENCRKYGRLYSEAASVSGKALQKKGSIVVQGLCPDGWHLPTRDEFETLFETVGGKNVAATKLTSSGGWGDCAHKGGTDDFAFSIVQSGLFNKGWGSYNTRGSYFWYAKGTNEAGCKEFWYNFNDIYAKKYGEEMEVHNECTGANHPYYSIRCLKDSEGGVASIDSSFWDSQASVLTDFRDMNTYRTTQIDNQIWMAENLNFETVGSVCAAGDCEKYGFLYTWGAAMDSAGFYSANGRGCGYDKLCSITNPVRGVCPLGWHLPTEKEFKMLIDAAGGHSRAGKLLKSSSGWDENNGTDDFSFSALPAGLRNAYGDLYDEGRNTSFWSSDGSGDYDAKSMSFTFEHADKNYAFLSSSKKEFGHSVRCLKDSEPSLGEIEQSASEETITDSRDGQIYRIIRIGNREWMADNLNFSTSTNSKCYRDKHYNCKKYGRLYDKDGVDLNICPDGFKVPDNDELANVSGSQSFKETVKNDVFKHHFWTSEKELIPRIDRFLEQESYFPVRCVR